MAEANSREVSSIPHPEDRVAQRIRTQMQTRVPRRPVAGTIAKVLLGLGALGLARYVVPEVGKAIETAREKLQLNVQQQRALEFYHNAAETEFVDGLVARGVTEGDRFYPVIERDRPSTANTTKHQMGNEIGKLPAQKVIPKAIVVGGNNPHRVFGETSPSKSESPWFFFQDPDSKKWVFAHSDGFGFDPNLDNPNLDQVKQFDVWQP